MRRSLVGRSAVVSVVMVAGSALLVTPAHPVAGARDSTTPDVPAPVRSAGPGKGDGDGDRIADDLEAAVAGMGPRERVRVIVQGVPAHRAAARASSLTVRHDFRLIEGFTGAVNAGQVNALARVPGATFVELDGLTGVLDAAGERDYGVRAARSAIPSLDPDGVLDGSGVGICVVDTGIDPGHEQLSGRVDGWKDFVSDRTTPYDDHGHGTHVASIAAGDGTGANATTADSYGGVARSARLYGAKVLDSTGYGADSDVVLGIEWCAAQPGVDVISMSLGSPGGDGSDAASVASAQAVAGGTVVVAAAGNDGDGLTIDRSAWCLECSGHRRRRERLLRSVRAARPRPGTGPGRLLQPRPHRRRTYQARRRGARPVGGGCGRRHHLRVRVVLRNLHGYSLCRRGGRPWAWTASQALVPRR